MPDDYTQQRLDELATEVKYLRAYGNKDCTDQADEARVRGDLDADVDWPSIRPPVPKKLPEVSAALTAAQQEEFLKLVRPLVKYLCDSDRQHVSVIVTPTDAKLVSGVYVAHIIGYLRDEPVHQQPFNG